MKKFELLTKTKLEDFLRKTSVDDLRARKRYYDDIYYNTGENRLDDFRYDLMKDILIERDQNYVLEIGSKLRDDEVEVNLPYYLGSMNKVKPNEQKVLDKWLKENECNECVIMDKLDGISCLLCVNGNDVNLYTRADGTTGKDISYIRTFVNYIPNNLPDDLYIRGELAMSKKNFDKLPGGKVNPRNTVSGAVKAKTAREALYSIDFVAYEMIESGIEQENLTEQMSYLDDLGFRTVKREICNQSDLTMDLLVNKLEEYRESGSYEIDGIIVQKNEGYIRNTNKNPKYAIAFKKDTIVETTVLDVIWTVTRRGFLKPVVHVEPIKVCGATISKATGYNAWFIKENNIGPGAKIELVRSGDVIPKVIDVIEGCPDGPKFPPDTEYVWNDSHVEIMSINNNNNNNVVDKQTKIITYFMSTMKIKHVSEATVKRIIESGYSTIAKILSMKISDFEKVERFGKKLAERTYNSIHDSLQDVDLATLMAASNCFDLGIGVKRMKLIHEDLPELPVVAEDLQDTKYVIEALDEDNKLDEEYVAFVLEVYERIKNIEGFSDITAKKVIEGLPKFSKFWKRISKYITISEPVEIDDTIPQLFEGKKIVCSGFRKILDDEIQSRGGELTDSVSRKTFCVIVKEHEDTPSGKAKKAITYNVPIYTVQEFRDEYLA